MSVNMMKLGTILVRRKLISQNQLDRGLDLIEITGKRIGELLLENGEVSNPQLQEALKEQYWRNNGFWIID